MANMKNKIRTLTYKITIAGLAGAGTLAVMLFSGCSGCSAKPQPVSEVVAEASEPVSEIIEVSEEPSEEFSEVAPVVVELPELPILDENGNVYNPGMFTTEDVYAAIDKMVAENDFENDLERDKAIAFMIYANSPYISKDTFMTVKEDYLANIYDSDINHFCWDFIDNNKSSKVPINYLFLDEKQGDAALQIVNYCNSDSYSRDEYNEFALNYVLFSKENIGYNPINHLLFHYDKSGSIKKGIDDMDELIYLTGGYKKITVDDIGTYRIEKKFGDGKSYLFEKTARGNYDYYTSSHK